MGRDTGVSQPPPGEKPRSDVISCHCLPVSGLSHGGPALKRGAEQLEELSERCGGLLGALHDAWYDGDGALRPEFAKPKKGKAPAGDVQ